MEFKKIIGGAKLALDANMPKILVIGGSAVMLAGTVLACVKTTKFKEVKKVVTESISAVKETRPETTEDKAAMTVYRKELVKSYGNGVVEYSKLYAVPTLMIGTGIAMTFKGCDIFDKRQAATMAALVVSESSFSKYRKGVADRFGEETEREVYFGVREETHEEPVLDKEGNQKLDKEGNPKVVRTVVKTAPVAGSRYSKLFDELNPAWQDDAYHNISFIKMQQSAANDILRTRGYIYLNEVYRMLGFEPTQAGAVMGWVYDYQGEDYIGDEDVDFGVFGPGTDERREAFIAGEEKSVLLDFNCAPIARLGYFQKF